MTNDPHIPMSPDELPQQRIHEVVELPVRPEPFDCLVGYGCKAPQKALSENEPKSPTTTVRSSAAYSDSNPK